MSTTKLRPTFTFDKSNASRCPCPIHRWPWTGGLLVRNCAVQRPQLRITNLTTQHNLCKPEPAIYQCLLDRLGLDPASTLFIDDMQVNLDAASALGIRSLLFTSVESCCRDLLSLGVHLACAST